jgi:hypothetical protein
MSQIPTKYQVPVSSFDDDQPLEPLAPLAPVSCRNFKLKTLYVINQEYPVRAVITIMTLEEPYEGHYVGQLKKVEHRYKTEYIPIAEHECLTPLASGSLQEMSENKIVDGVLQLYFQV